MAARRRHRIPAVAAPGVASSQSARRQPNAASCAMGLDRLDGVGGTARHVPTGGDPPRERLLVQPQSAPDGAGGRVQRWSDRGEGLSRQGSLRPRRRAHDLKHQSCPMSAGDPGGAARNCWSQPWAAHLSGTNRGQLDLARQPARAGWNGVGDGRDCARPPHRRGARWRTQPAVVLRWAPEGPDGSRSRRRYERGSRIGGARPWCGDHAPARSGRQAVAALEPAASQHRPAGAIRHAVPEAVALGAPTDVWLIGALHDLPPEPRSLPGPRRVRLPRGLGSWSNRTRHEHDVNRRLASRAERSPRGVTRG
jgi:hypothetical protein